MTLLLSFTGYLLPWDQLAFWAITVGTNIAASVPVIGEQMRQFLLGGTVIGQPTLIRFYVLHCALLPLALFGVAVWHMWRVRKDGGLAIVEQASPRGRRARAATSEEVEDLQHPRHRQRNHRPGPRPDDAERGQLPSGDTPHDHAAVAGLARPPSPFR